MGMVITEAGWEMDFSSSSAEHMAQLEDWMVRRFQDLLEDDEAETHRRLAQLMLNCYRTRDSEQAFAARRMGVEFGKTRTLLSCQEEGNEEHVEFITREFHRIFEPNNIVTVMQVITQT